MQRMRGKTSGEQDTGTKETELRGRFPGASLTFGEAEWKAGCE